MLYLTENMVAIGDLNGRIGVYRIDKQRFCGFLASHGDAISQLSLERTGEYIASCGEDTIKFWQSFHLFKLQEEEGEIMEVEVDQGEEFEGDGDDSDDIDSEETDSDDEKEEIEKKESKKEQKKEKKRKQQNTQSQSQSKKRKVINSDRKAFFGGFK